ncbi:GMC family oxidoreductase N-terminal domain-containing protein [Alcaligenaceae bacterium]|nr:GMC family oxidoreductase N-terminal domain-containing protein [Alcaligenaceae bacterium]
MTYDYVIIGAGSAGAVLANRLTANLSDKVLLLEAGGDGSLWTRVPGGVSRLVNNPSSDWCYRSVPEEATANRRLPVSRGRLLGGSSAINGMVYTRGQSQDYDDWARMGNAGWSHRDVSPVFKAMERCDFGDEALRGREGPLHVTETPGEGPFYDALFSAAAQVGIPRNPDYNGAYQDGIGMTQATIFRGRRASTATCYLEPARARHNLTVLTNAFALRLLFDGRRCIGVAYLKDGVYHEVNAAKEVILSAGTINSPQLLELSGIGQADRLRSLGISVYQHLPGVGENLRDHFAPRLIWRVTQPGISYNDQVSGVGLLKELAKYVFRRRGLLSMPVAPVRAYIRTHEGATRPDAGIFFYPYSMSGRTTSGLAAEPAIMATTNVLRSESRGSVHISSPAGRHPPEIRFNFLSSAYDRRTLIAAVRKTQEFMAASSLDVFRGDQLAPRGAVQSDKEITDWVRNKAQTTYHPVGTCKMGIDDMSVTDARLRVHGVEGLRIVDASIMPTLTSGNTNAPTIMIAEKASTMILEDN